MQTRKVEWEARWSGGMKESAVLVRDGQAIPQRDFARHIKHVSGGYELYRADVNDGDVILFLYRSGSGRTRTAQVLGGDMLGDWDEAEQSLNLPEGALEEAFSA